MSALEQTTPNLELLVRIDGPNAICHEGIAWLRQLAKAESRLLLLEGERNLGTFGSLRRVFNDAQGEYLVQLDADDILHPKAIALGRAALAKDSSLSYVYTKCTEIDSAGHAIREGKRQSMPYSDLNMLVQFITFHMRCIRRSCYDVVDGYRPALLYSGDYDLSLRLAEVGRVAFLPLPLYFYRIHGANTSAKDYQSTVIEAYGVARDALYRRGLASKIHLSLTHGNCVRGIRLRKWEPPVARRDTASVAINCMPSSWL